MWVVAVAPLANSFVVFCNATATDDNMLYEKFGGKDANK